METTEDGQTQSADGADGAGGAPVEVLGRDVTAVRAAVVTLRQKFDKFNTRAWHMSHDMSGIRMDIADITDDLERLFARVDEIGQRHGRMDMELAQLRADMARQTALLERLVDAADGTAA